ncbi:MAG TPA: GspH/FimT family pseudopilin, partial [Candidatus Edwardsbacteria bacterium]|nr:GspH/FimT family pseudopilin [Candidatus Edwardsbacteria bacterium]
MKNKGFTLIELMVVLVVMGILIGIAAYSFTGIINNSRARGAADKIVQELQGARERAYSRGHPVDVTFSATAKGGVQMTVVFHTATGDETRPVSAFDECRLGLISAGVTKVPPDSGAAPSSGIYFTATGIPANTCRFQPQGASNTGSVYIKSLNGVYQYAVMANANGRVRRYTWTGTS